MVNFKYNCLTSAVNFHAFVLLLVTIGLILPLGSTVNQDQELSRVKRANYDTKLDWIIEHIKSLEADETSYIVFNVDSMFQQNQALQRFIPKCVAALTEGDIIGGSKNWAQIKIQAGNNTQTTQLLEATIQEIVSDTYKGKPERMTSLLKFIQNERNFVPKSPLAETSYQFLINELEDYGQLICKTMPVAGLIVGVPSHTFKMLKEIKNNVGPDSAVFNSIPSSGRSIIQGQEVVLRNKLTNAYLYLRVTASCEGVSAEECTKPRVVTSDNFPSTRDERFIWRFKPVEHKWEEGLELYYIENASGDKVVAVRSGDGSLTVKTVNEETRRSTWAMFYVHMVNKEDEVIFQCSYWGLKTLAFQSNDTVVPKLMDPNLLKPLDEELGGRWSVQEWKAPT